jgi:hypothetical protein
MKPLEFTDPASRITYIANAIETKGPSYEKVKKPVSYFIYHLTFPNRIFSSSLLFVHSRQTCAFQDLYWLSLTSPQSRQELFNAYPPRWTSVAGPTLRSLVVLAEYLEGLQEERAKQEKSHKRGGAAEQLGRARTRWDGSVSVRREFVPSSVFSPVKKGFVESLFEAGSGGSDDAQTRIGTGSESVRRSGGGDGRVKEPVWETPVSAVGGMVGTSTRTAVPSLLRARFQKWDSVTKTSAVKVDDGEVGVGKSAGAARGDGVAGEGKDQDLGVLDAVGGLWKAVTGVDLVGKKEKERGDVRDSKKSVLNYRLVTKNAFEESQNIVWAALGNYLRAFLSSSFILKFA